MLIDGRTVYTPLFSGVFWDAQDVVLEDIERIEVISGPGATLWGANAVNGVINVITQSASTTQGGLVATGASKQQRNGVVRYGGALEKWKLEPGMELLTKRFKLDAFATKVGIMMDSRAASES